MDRNTKHNKAMAKQKAAVDEGIAKAMAKARPVPPLAW